MNFLEYYANQAGGGTTDYFQAPFWQKGYGFGRGMRGGSFFSSIGRTIGPYLAKFTNFIKPIAKQVGNTLKTSALTGVSNIAADIASGKQLPEAFSTGITKAIDVIRDDSKRGIKDLAASLKDNGAAIPETIKVGAGYKRKNKKKKKFIILKPKSKKARIESDIFGEF